jgi:hypothetical protein
VDFCEKQIQEIDEFAFKKIGNVYFLNVWKEKSKPIFDLLEQTNHDWEVLFCLWRRILTKYEW